MKERFCPWCRHQFRLDLVFSHYPSIHNAQHCARVLRYALMIAEAKGLSREQKETLAAAAVFHDCGRLADGYDVGHGARSAARYREYCAETGMAYDPISAELMAWHDRHDADGVAAIERAHPDRADAVLLYQIFKDSDGLDRLRLGPNELDLDRLRTPEGRALYDYARKLACG